MRQSLLSLPVLCLGLLIACQSQESGTQSMAQAPEQTSVEPLSEGGRFITPSEFPEEEVSSTSRRHVISGKQAMVVLITMDPLSEADMAKEVQLHSHPAEQITYALQGSFTMTLGGKTHAMQAGDMCIIPSNVLHGGKPGPEGCKLMDVFSPVREEFMANAITVEE